MRNKELIQQVKAYERAHNHFDVDAIMEMLADNAVLEFVGLGTFNTRAEIQALHAYDKAIRTQVHFQNCTVEENQVVCEAIETNDWLSAAGLAKIFYPSSIFTFTTTGKIQKISAMLAEPDSAAMGAVLAAFTPWLNTERPQESRPLFSSEGTFNYSEANGTLVVSLLKQWRTLALEAS